MNKTIHRLSIQGEQYLKNIMAGKKKYEGRIFTSACKQMKPGDLLELYENSAGWGIVCEITCMHPFSSFEEMLRSLGTLQLLPQLEKISGQLTSEELLHKGVKIYQEFPGSERVFTMGCVAIGVRYLEKMEQI